jgi:hypothetical protein
MPEYKCELCNFSSILRPNYIRHLQTPKHKKRMVNSFNLLSDGQKKEFSSLLNPENSLKNPEKSLKNPENSLKNPESLSSSKKKRIKISEGDSLHYCEYCEKHFSRKDNLKIHQNMYCKEKKIRNEDDSFKEMVEKTILEQSKNIENLIEIVGNKTMNGGNNESYNNVHSHNNNNNTINNTININNYGNENLGMLTNKFMSAMIDRPYTAIPKMIKKIHFNDNYPENKNIRMLNKKDNKIQIIENGEWTYVDKEETIDMLVGDKNYQLDEYYEKNKSNFTPRQIDRFNKFQDKIGESDKKVNINIVKGTDLVFWNHM